MTKPRPRYETASRSSDQSPAVSPPSGIDPDWRERIEIAKQARVSRPGRPAATGQRPSTSVVSRSPGSRIVGPAGSEIDGHPPV